jgi:serine O-acetyltransferase
MFENIKADLNRYCQKEGLSPTFNNKKSLIINNYGLQAILVYRFGKWAQKRSRVYSWILLGIHALFGCLVRNFYGIHLNLHASIGKGFCIIHFGGISVQGGIIGKNCSMHQNVSVRPAQHGYPVIGDNVWLGGHVDITGAVSIKNCATIGAGAVVTSDIKERCMVLGNPARIITNGFDNRAILGLAA